MQLCHSSCRRSCVLLDRLMWMCHTGRAAAALTQKPHRAAIRTARERERGTCATLPGTQITAYSSISNIKTEMGKKGITEKSSLWILTGLARLPKKQKKEKAWDSLQESWEPLWWGFIIWPNQKNQLFFFFFLYFIFFFFFFPSSCLQKRRKEPRWLFQCLEEFDNSPHFISQLSALNYSL